MSPPSSRRWIILLVALSIISGLHPGRTKVEAFSARLPKPWESLPSSPVKGNGRMDRNGKKLRKSPAPIQLYWYLTRVASVRAVAATLSPSGASSMALSASANDSNAPPKDDGDADNVSPLFVAASQGTSSSTSSGNSEDRSKSKSKLRVNGGSYEPAPGIWSKLKPLFQLCRPANFPGVVLLHALGAHLALSSQAINANNYRHFYMSTVLSTPAMWAVLVALLLTSSTSMLVNDYFDKKLGRDTDKVNSPLMTGELTLSNVRSFLNILYAAALVCLSFVPGVPSRLAVVWGLMLTFWYTKHLKPLTWIKNVMCACLIALSPFASGSAALKVASETTPSIPWGNLRFLWVPALWRLVAFLFFGVCAREVVMDITDVRDDSSHGVKTIPVKYGRRFASGVALFCYAMSGIFVIGGPVSQFMAQAGGGDASITAAVLRSVWRANAGNVSRRLIFAVLGGVQLMRRAWQVFQTKGENQATIDKMVNEAQLTMILCLVSFL